MKITGLSHLFKWENLHNWWLTKYFFAPLCVCVCVCVYIYIYIYIYISGGPLSALTCCVNVRLLSAIKKNIAVNLFSKLGWELGLYYASYDDFHPDILARMYT